MTVRSFRFAGPGIFILLLIGLLGVPCAGNAQLPAPPVSSPGPLHVGGYGSLSFGYSRVAGAPREFDLTEAAAAVLLSGTPWNRFSYFGELDLASRGSENWTGRQDDRRLEVERLYAEYSFSDALRVRAGRFLTPIGQWNESHAEPLTWSTLRPLTTYRPFAKSSTGAMVAGETTLAGREVGYAAFLAPPGLSHETDEESAFLNAVGGRVAVEMAPGSYLGLSLVGFKGSRPEGRHEMDGPDGEEGGEGREEDSRERALMGVDFLARVRRMEVSGEAVWLEASEREAPQRGAFVQGVIPLVGTLYGVLRAEAYRPVDEGTLLTYTMGATWRLHRRLVLKLDRQITRPTSSRVPDGWFFSVSSLF